MQAEERRELRDAANQVKGGPWTKVPVPAIHLIYMLHQLDQLEVAVRKERQKGLQQWAEGYKAGQKSTQSELVLADEMEGAVA